LNNDIVIKGMQFRLTSEELRALILAQARNLQRWLNEHDEPQERKWHWRRQLYDLLLWAGENLEPDATYELDRYEVMSLFEIFED